MPRSRRRPTTIFKRHYYSRQPTQSVVCEPCRERGDVLAKPRTVLCAFGAGRGRETNAKDANRSFLAHMLTHARPSPWAQTFALTLRRSSLILKARQAGACS